MKTFLRKGLFLFLAAYAASLLAVPALAAEEAAKPESAPAAAGAPVDKDALPAFSLKTLDGAVVDNAKIKGKPSVFLIMQTACNICRGEIQDVNGISQNPNYKAIDFYIVNVDFNPKLLPGYLKENDIKIPALLDPDFSFGKKFGISFTPAAVFANKDGKVVGMTKGYNEDSLGEIKKNLDAIK